MGFSWGGLIVGLVIVAIFYVGFTSESIYSPTSSMKSSPLPEPLKTVFHILAFPDDWLYTPAIFYLFIVPFIGLYAIVYGFLREINIFSRVQNVNGVLAFVISFSTLPLNVFVRVVGTTFAVMGMYSFIAFGVLFFSGIFFYSKSRFLGFRSEFDIAEQKIKREMEEARREIREIDKKYNKGDMSHDAYVTLTDSWKTKLKDKEAEKKSVKAQKKMRKARKG